VCPYWANEGEGAVVRMVKEEGGWGLLRGCSVRKKIMSCYIKRFQIERHDEEWRAGLTSTRCSRVSKVGQEGGRLG